MSDTAEIREWARTHGFSVGARGRFSVEILTAFAEAHGQKPVRSTRGPRALETDHQFSEKYVKTRDQTEAVCSCGKWTTTAPGNKTGTPVTRGNHEIHLRLVGVPVS